MLTTTTTTTDAFLSFFKSNMHCFHYRMRCNFWRLIQNSKGNGTHHRRLRGRSYCTLFKNNNQKNIIMIGPVMLPPRGKWLRQQVRVRSVCQFLTGWWISGFTWFWDWFWRQAVLATRVTWISLNALFLMCICYCASAVVCGARTLNEAYLKIIHTHVLKTRDNISNTQCSALHTIFKCNLLLLHCCWYTTL